MAKDIISEDGKEVIVREDTAKAYRFKVWSRETAIICLAIMAILTIIFFLWSRLR
jgi:hypothetical protein